MANLKRLLYWLIFSLALYGCASTLPAAKPLAIQPPKLPPAPSDVMVQQEQDFLKKMMQRFSFRRQAEPTPSSDSSQPVKP